jgi:hypothetical protein
VTVNGERETYPLTVFPYDRKLVVTHRTSRREPAA